MKAQRVYSSCGLHTKDWNSSLLMLCFFMKFASCSGYLLICRKSYSLKLNGLKNKLGAGWIALCLQAASGPFHVASPCGLSSMTTSGYLDFLQAHSGFRVRVAKTQTELQDFFLIYSKKSPKVTPVPFCCSDGASPDSMWEDTTHRHEYWEVWIRGAIVDAGYTIPLPWHYLLSRD